MRCSVTSAMPVGLRSRVPAKMTSSMRAPRSDFADCSPNTHEIASEMFDLPQPLGPTMAVMPSPGNLSSVRSQNDLKPKIWSFLSFSNFQLLACSRSTHILDGCGPHTPAIYASKCGEIPLQAHPFELAPGPKSRRERWLVSEVRRAQPHRTASPPRKLS